MIEFSTYITEHQHFVKSFLMLTGLTGVIKQYLCHEKKNFENSDIRKILMKLAN